MEPIGDTPAGEVHLDIAVERPLIARARRSPEDPEVLATLTMLRETLLGLLGPRAIEGVLGLVAALPLSVRPLVAGEASALVVLARRRADIHAKHNLALALLPDLAAAATVGLEGGPALRVDVGGTTRTVDLSGPEVAPSEPGTPRMGA